jgi:hypothetical protein
MAAVRVNAANEWGAQPAVGADQGQFTRLVFAGIRLVKCKVEQGIEVALNIEDRFASTW